MKYEFKGKITSLNIKEIPFEIFDGRIRFLLRSVVDIDITKKNVHISGSTDDGKEIHLLIDYFWKANFEHTIYENKEVICVPHIEGIISACAVVNVGCFDKIDSLGFFSSEIEKITNSHVSGNLNDENTNGMDIKKELASYNQNSNKYHLSIGFVENYPAYKWQLLELRSNNFFDISMMRDSYWTIKKLLSFLYQKRIVPIQEIYLRNQEENVGQLFVEHIDSYNYIFNSVRCIPIFGWNEKLSSLIQLLVDKKIYLRHIPIFKDDEKAITHGRFLMGLIGLENVMDYLKIYVPNKKTKKGFLSKRIAFCIEMYKSQISNFFDLDSLGNDIATISEELATIRNKFAHGELNYDLTMKSSYQMHFIMLFVLFLQLLMIGFNEEEAKVIVPNILYIR